MAQEYNNFYIRDLVEPFLSYFYLAYVFYCSSRIIILIILNDIYNRCSLIQYERKKEERNKKEKGKEGRKESKEGRQKERRGKKLIESSIYCKFFFNKFSNLHIAT